jgi:hypothetical protein
VEPEIGGEGRVAEEEQLPAAGVELGVRGHRPHQRAVEVVLADGVQLGGELGGQRRLHERQQSATMVNDVGVGGVLEQPRLGLQLRWRQRELRQPAKERPSGASLCQQTLGLDPPVAVGGPTVLVEGDCVDHAVAVEDVVAAPGRERGVGAVAGVGADQPGGDVAGDLEVGHDELVGDRCVEPGQVAVGVRGGVGHGVSQGERCSPQASYSSRPTGSPSTI